MNIDQSVFSDSEKYIFELRSLYSRYGYSQYKMSKFEEYDLYSKNKDFLISDSVITFTDTNGKLMALKPDVTLSIIKNSKDTNDTVQKLYYNENVYRVSKGTNSFKEIMQTGLECIGNIDSYCVFEVLYLAAKSLETVSDRFVLDISDLRILSVIVDSISPSVSLRRDIIKCVSEKNIHGITQICRENDIPEENAEYLKKLLSIYGKPNEVLKQLEYFSDSIEIGEYIANLKEALSVFEGTDLESNIRIDFSVTSDMNYYNGIVFKGFIDGIPGSVLSGGQYDKLMEKMNRKSRAIGFAVYLDLLERYGDQTDCFDFDLMLIYDDKTTPAEVRRLAEKEMEKGCSVFAGKTVSEKLKFKKIAKIVDGEVKYIENNA